MAMSTGAIFAQGLLGGLVGGGKAVAHIADEERKAEVERIREERLAKLRMDEYRQKEAMAEAKDKKTKAERAAFYERTGPKEVEQPGVEVDEQGNEIGVIDGLRNETRREVADRRMEESRKTGDAALMKDTYTEAKDIRAEEEQQRKAKADETKAEAAARAAAQRDRDLERRERDSEDRTRRTDALIARALGGGEGGKSPAKIREVRELADMAFGGDVEKAVQFVYGMNEKPRTEAVIRMAQLLKDDVELSGDPKKLMARAEEMVDSLRAKEAPRRGGVSPGGDKPAPKTSETVAKPKSKAEYDALPSGSLYVHRDGNTYRKP